VNVMNLIPAAQSEALLREIEQQAGEECRTAIAAAEQEARTIVAHAHAAARQRVHEAIGELRREGVRRLSRARAQIETAARQSAQRHALKLIERAWPLLADALLARWRDPATRRTWADAAAGYARDRLKAERWAVEHPPGWSADEQLSLCKALGAADAAVTFTVDRALAAGIRIKAAGATIDATAQGLLADRAAVAAQLLAEIDKATADANARPGGERR
jgi:vacuolar-type H+-ATPase subunit H